MNKLTSHFDNSDFVIIDNNNNSQVIDNIEKSYRITLNSIEKENAIREREYYKEIIHLKDIIKEKEDEVKTLTLKIDNMNDILDKDNSSNEIKTLKDIIGHLKEKLLEDMYEINNLKKNKNEMDKKKDELNKKLFNLQDIIKATERVNEALSNQIKEKEITIKNNQIESNKMLNEMNIMKTEIKKIDEIKETYEKEKKTLGIIINGLKMENCKLKEENALIKNELDKLKKQQHINNLTDTDEMNNNIEIVSNFLFRFYLSQYSITVFDLLEIIAINKEKLDEIYSNDNNVYQINDIVYQFYIDIKNYILLNPRNIICLNDYFAKMQIDIKNDQNIYRDILLKIKTFQSHGKIFDLYKNKKDNYIKSAENTFNLIRKYIEEKNNKKVNYNNINDLFKVENSSVNLNFNEFYQNNKNINTCLFSYYIKKAFKTSENISITISPKNTMNEMYTIANSISLYCHNIKSLQIKGIDNINYNNGSNSNNNYQNLCIPFIENLELFISSSPKLVHLSFEYLDFSSHHNIFNITLEQLKNTKIERLDLISTLSSKSLSSLSTYIINNQRLKHLNLSHHNIQIPTILFPSIANSSSITSLNLSYNNINKLDFQALSQFIENNQHLEYLDISHNVIPTTVCTSFGNGLSKSNSLTTMIMENCDLNDERILLILNRMVHSLCNIILDNNPIGDTGLIGISAYAKYSNRLKLLSVRNCNISNVGISPFLMNVSFSSSSELQINFENNNKFTEDISVILEKSKDKYIKEKYIFKFSESNLKSGQIKKLKSLGFVEISK